MGNSGKGYLFANAAIEMSGVRMNLYTAGGTINTEMPLFLKTKNPIPFSSPTLNLEIAGSHLSFPRSQKVMPLFLPASTGFGSPSGVMNLVLPQVKAPIFFDKRLLYIKGLMPVGDIPLYLEAPKQTINTTPLYTKGPRMYSVPDSMNLFVQQKDFFTASYINAVPTIVGTGNIPLFTHGFAAPTGAINFVMPNVIGSGTNTRQLYIRGYQ